jgi:excinuclease ABC subunit C
MNNKQTKLLDKAKSLPTKAGCYLMKRYSGDTEEILYVGKAKNLKNRVISYFNNSVKGPKTEVLVGHIQDFDFIITENDTEAFVLENNLIKKHSPKYNIRLKDDRSYPYVSIDKNHDFPKLQYSRKIKRGKGREVYGPFVVGSNISEVLRIVTKSFTLRDCTERDFKSRKEPCLLYQLKQCSAPCVNLISKSDYDKDIELASNFFKGKGDKSLKVLKNKMHELAVNEEFEHAAIIRDYVEVLEEFMEYSKQRNAEMQTGDKDIDIFAYHIGEIEVDISLYMMRNGILLGHKNFNFSKPDNTEELEEELLSFLYQYYTNTNDSIPATLITSFNDDQNKLLEDALAKIDYLKIKTKSPGRKFDSLMRLTKDHAFEHQRVRLTNQDSVYVGLNKLGELLGLKERPRLLECFDVAIFQGSSPTASQIVFHEGVADKKSYRHYHLDERPEGNNDFAMMKEMLRRRIPHGKLPDVFIVDGGVGQVNMFLEVLKEFNLNVPVAGIAKSKSIKKKMSFKDKTIDHSEERLVIPGRSNSYVLKKCKPLFRIATQMRDEAHRFSRRLHHKQEKKKLFSSWLDQVEGVGPKTKEKLLTRLDKSVPELKKMSKEELAKYFDVSLKMASQMVLILKDQK